MSSRNSITLVVMVVLFVVGLVLHDADAFAFVHEGFHSGAAIEDGIAVLERHPTRTVVERHNVNIILAGYWGELFSYALMALVAGRWGTIFSGYLVGVMGRAPVSTDFLTHLYDYGYRNTGSAELAQRAVDMNLVNWNVAVVVVVLLLIARYGWTLFRMAKESPQAGHPGATKDRVVSRYDASGGFSAND